MRTTRSMTATAVLTMAALAAGTGAVTAQEPVVGVPTVPTGYAVLDQALGADKPFNGTKVSIQTQWIGGEGNNFADSIAAFEAATGIDIQVDSISSNHETLLATRILGNAAPDLAVLAQPSAIVKYGNDGMLIDIASFIEVDKLAAEHPATVGLYSTGDQTWGLPFKLDVKSTVWYPIKAFETAGYKVPTTWDELIALSDQIVADGSSPWCLAFESGTATGWEATDWVEDIMLRTAGIDAYNKWITGELKFNSPEVKAAWDKAGQIFFTPGYAYGGTTAIIATDFRTAMDPMFNEDMAKPGCWMQKIPGWYGPDFFPDARTTGEPSKFVIGEDVGMFYLPPIDPAMGTPALGSGDAVMMFNDRAEVQAVVEFLATPEALEAWIKAGSAIGANQATPAEWYEGAYKLKVAADIVANASAFGFDASDLMRPEVGAGSFWTKISEWINSGGTDTEAVLQAIDDTPAQ